MDDNFKLRAALKTDEELRNYVDNREKYLPESVEAAVAELQHRGEEFSDEELSVIREDMQARRDLAKAPASYNGLFRDPESAKQVDDPEAPVFYTKRAIYGFSVFCSLFFGAIMLAVNVNKTKDKSGIIWIVLYGLGFTIAVAILAQTFHLNTGLGLVLNIIGTYPLNNFFWKKYIGDDTLYRVKPIWIPLTIAIILTAIVFIILLKYGPQPFK